MKVISNIGRLTVAVLLAGLAGLLLTSCSDVKHSDLGNLYPQDVQVVTSAPSTDQQMVQQVLSQNAQTSSNSVPDLTSLAGILAGQGLSADSVTAVLDQIKGSTVIMNQMTLTPQAGQQFTQPSATDINNLPADTKPAQTVGSLGFQMTTTVPTGNTITAPTLIQMAQNASNPAALSMANMAAVSTGDTALTWGMKTTTGDFIPSENVTTAGGQPTDVTDMTLSDLGLGMTRNAVASSMLRIRGLGLLFSVNKGLIPSWTIPSNYNFSPIKQSNGKYMLKDSYLTMHWDGGFSVPPTGGFVDASVVLYDGQNVVATLNSHSPVSRSSNGGSVTITGKASVSFTAIKVLLDVRNKVSSNIGLLKLAATIPAPKAAANYTQTQLAGMACVAANGVGATTVLDNTGSAFKITSLNSNYPLSLVNPTTLTLDPNGVISGANISPVLSNNLNVTLNKSLALMGANTLMLKNGAINAGSFGIKGLTFKFNANGANWTLPSSWNLTLARSGLGYKLVGQSFMQLAWQGAGFTAPADGKVAVTIKLYSGAALVGTVTQTGTISGNTVTFTDTQDSLAFDNVDVTVDMLNSKI